MSSRASAEGARSSVLHDDDHHGDSAAGTQCCANAHAAPGATPRGPRASLPLAVRFGLKVNKSGPVPAHCPELGPCWLWTASVNVVSGYGQINAGGRGRMRPTHRVAWELERGPIPRGLWVLHRCDMRRCVRPEHLFLGTAQDNNADMRAKGRGFMPVSKGSVNGNSKLDEASVIDIRRKRAAGFSYPRIGREHGISATQAANICTGKQWSHVAAEARQ